MIINSENFSSQIKKIRQEKGWSQRQMADYCQVSKRTIEGWEYGRSPEKYVMPLLELFLAFESADT